MGTYTDFSIAGYPLIETKNGVIPEIMTVFRETDRQVFKRKLSERNPLVWGDDYAENKEAVETAIHYSCDTENAVARLDVMGFTLSRSRHDYETLRQVKLKEYQDILDSAPDESDTSWLVDTIQLVKSIDFDEYLKALRQVLSEGLRPHPFEDCKEKGLSSFVQYILKDNEDQFLGFFAADIRCLVRAACEVAPKPSKLIQDITDLIESGYLEQDEPICQKSIDSLTLGHLENFNRIVLTEGSTDTWVLRSSLNLLYPHLAGYYSFLDFDSARVSGGAGQLASLVKGFAASGIGNQIIAIFDNDSAARDAIRPLRLLSIPSNIAVLRYPDIGLLNSYPTIGPSGNTDLDVNGLAASIELYFGSDILTLSDGTMAPIQWKGYVQSIECYQGEVTGKGALQDSFKRKLLKAQQDPTKLLEQDWTGIDAILNVIFGAFTNEA